MSITLEFDYATIQYCNDTVMVWNGTDTSKPPIEIDLTDMVLFMEMAGRYRNKKEGIRNGKTEENNE